MTRVFGLAVKMRGATTVFYRWYGDNKERRDYDAVVYRENPRCIFAHKVESEEDIR